MKRSRNYFILPIRHYLRINNEGMEKKGGRTRGSERDRIKERDEEEKRNKIH
jgi:hypothetical protein